MQTSWNSNRFEDLNWGRLHPRRIEQVITVCGTFQANDVSIRTSEDDSVDFLRKAKIIERIIIVGLDEWVRNV